MSDAERWLTTPALGVAEEEAPLLILAHGAGAGMHGAFLERISAMIAAHGVSVARFEFAYMARARQRGRRAAPPRAERLMEEYERRLDHWRARGRRLFIGGKSMGGRIASMIADGLYERGRIAGLVCLGYPFHPPGRAAQLRIAHLRGLKTPALICQGERDPFGRREEVEGFELSPRIALCWLADGDHDFKPRVKSGETWKANLQRAASCCADFIHAATEP